jgi:hypothetical protein
LDDWIRFFVYITPSPGQPHNLLVDTLTKHRKMSSSPPRRMTRARAKKEGFEPDWRINPQWRTPKKPRQTTKRSKPVVHFDAPPSEDDEEMKNSALGGGQRLVSPTKIFIPARLLHQPQLETVPTSVDPESEGDPPVRKVSALGSPVRVRPRTTLKPTAPVADKENSSSAAMLSIWTQSSKPNAPKTPQPTRRSRPLELSPASTTSNSQPAIKVLSTPIRVPVPSTPSRSMGTARRIPVKREKPKDGVTKLEPVVETSTARVTQQRPASPTKLSEKTVRLPSHMQISPLRNSTIDLDSPDTTKWVPLKAVPFQRPKGTTLPLVPPSKAGPSIVFPQQTPSVLRSPERPLASILRSPAHVARPLEENRTPQRQTSNPKPFDSLEEFKPVSKPVPWKTPIKGPIHTPKTTRKVCFRTPSSDTPIKRRPQSILTLSIQEKQQDVSTTPKESPISPKVFNLSDPDDSGFEMFTPRKQRPISMPIVPKPNFAEPKLSRPEEPKPSEIPIPVEKSPPTHFPAAPTPSPTLARSIVLPKGSHRRTQSRDISVPLKPSHETPSTPSPSKPSRNDKPPLRGVIAYVDVKTADGDDASGPFIDALKSLGARVVKHWAWNGDATEKVGITHVVFKQGGPRTLTKVKLANGGVQCVGLGWISRYAGTGRLG